MKYATSLFRHFIVLILVLLWSGPCFSQYFEKPLKMPSKYLKPTEESLQNTAISVKKSPIIWKVWADRSGIVTSNGKRPEFLEEFYVVGEREDALHVVKDNGSYDPINAKFSTSVLPIDYGWISKNKLLLWYNSLYDNETNFRQKILTISDVDHMQKNMETIKAGSKLMEYHSSPVSMAPMDNETRIFEVFYVYKKVGNRVLIGKVEDLDNRTAKDGINGWVDESIVQVWGHRQTLEPNNNVKAARERESRKIEASLFSNMERTREYVSNPTDNRLAYWSSDNYEKGYDNQWYRMPILNKNGDIIETAVISDLLSVKKEKGTVSVDVIDDSIANIYNKAYQEQISRTAKINIVFVLDATKSMEKPLESVKKAVLHTASRLDNSINKFEYGAVIYRDYKNASDQSCFQSLRLGNYRSFYDFMNTVKTDDKACFNNTISEGMYKGLYMAKPLFRGKEKETNVIVLVGDAGDRKESWRVGETEVVEMLVKNSISLISIQAHKWDNKAYTDFITQTRSLSLKSANRLSDIQKMKYGGINLSARTTTPRFRNDTRGNRTLYNLENSPVDGALQHASSGTEIPPEIIEEEVSRIIRDIDSANTALLRSLALIVNRTLDPETFDPEVMQVLIKAGFDADFIEFLSTKRYQFMMGGYTAVKVQSLADEIYKYVLFLDYQELDGMIESLNKLVIPGRTASERREGLYNAFFKLLTVNYGVPVADIENMNLRDIMGLITGLPSTSPLLNIKVSDIRDPHQLPDHRLNDIIMHVKRKRDYLVRIPPSQEYSFKQDLKKYYWLPQEILP